MANQNSTHKQAFTGPKTPEGKAKSSQNARKASIFYQGYLPWEKPDEKQAQMSELSDQWQAYDPARQMILRSIEQASLSMERLMYAERLVIEGALQSTTMAKKFYEAAGMDLLNPLGYLKLPAWYFVEGDPEKDRAIKFNCVLKEAEKLATNFTQSSLSQVAHLFPDLYEYVMQGQQGSFLQILGQRFQQSNFSLNLLALTKELLKKYPFHILWADNAARYQAIIDGLRGQQMIEKMDLDKATRYATNFQNRIIKGFAALEAMDRYEAALNASSLTHKPEEVEVLEGAHDPEVLVSSDE